MRSYVKVLLLLLFISSALKVNAADMGVAYRIHNYKGERVGTCKRDTKVPVIYLYDMNGRRVENPAKYMGEPVNDCWLFDVDGIAIGKCSATRVILWGR